MRTDSEGNSFQVGHVYKYYSHKMELIRIDEENRGLFVLIEDYGALSKGSEHSLMFDNGFKYLYPGSSLMKTNKHAAKLLDKEW